MLTIREIKALSLPACKKFGVLRLDIFGSLSKDSANDKSDLDFLVEFENTDKLDFAASAGLFYSLEVGEDRKWFFEISAGSMVMIKNEKPNPELRFDLKFGRVF